MSEATLKKKTAVKYNNMSVGSKNGGFSINGTRRNQGYIGQTMLGRHFPNTPMRGNVARGHGGCCGKYPTGTIIQSGVCFPSKNGNTANNNPNVVKLSVLNTSGLIHTKYKWIFRPQPYTSVKIDNNLLQGTQQQYISNKSSSLINSLASCLPVIKTTSYNPNNCLTREQRPRPFGTTIHIPRSWCNITKSYPIVPISQTQFIQALNGSCSKNFKKAFSNGRKAPLPGPAPSY